MSRVHDLRDITIGTLRSFLYQLPQSLFDLSIAAWSKTFYPGSSPLAVWSAGTSAAAATVSR